VKQNKDEKDLATVRIYTNDKSKLEGIGKFLEAGSGLEATAPRVLRLALSGYQAALLDPAASTSSLELAGAIALLCQMYHHDSGVVRRIARDLQEGLTHIEEAKYDVEKAPAKGAGAGSTRKRAG